MRTGPIPALGRAVLTRRLVVAGTVAVAAGYLALVDPNRPGHYPSCPILLLTGYWCPGCGGLRAVHDLLHGQVSAALSANLVVVLMVPVGLVLGLRGVTATAAPGRPGRRSVSGLSWFLWSLLVFILLFWVLRNLSVTAWLAP